MHTPHSNTTNLARNAASDAPKLLHALTFLPLCRELVHRPEGINRLGMLQCPQGWEGGRKSQSIDWTSSELKMKHDRLSTRV